MLKLGSGEHDGEGNETECNLPSKALAVDRRNNKLMDIDCIWPGKLR